MPGIEEDIQRTEALGFVHTGFSGGAIEYQNYTCPRTGLVLSIPLGNGPYRIHTGPPEYRTVGRTPLIDDAFELIAQSATDPTVHIPPRQTPQEQAAYVAMCAREAALRPSRPVFPPLPPKPYRSSRKPSADKPASGPSGRAERAGSGRAAGSRATAGPSREPRRASTADDSSDMHKPSAADPAWLRYALLIFIGIPGLALLVWLVVSELPPWLLMPAMYVMGLGSGFGALVGAVAGATWGMAASTWLSVRNMLTILAGAAFGGTAAWLFAAPDDLLGPRVALYGALAAVSVLSSVLEHPTGVRPWLIAGAFAGGLIGGMLAGLLNDGLPSTALWLTALVAHGLIAVSSARIWQVLFGAEDMQPKRG